MLKKIKQRDIWVEWKYEWPYKATFPVGFEVSCYWKNNLLLFRFFYYFENFNSFEHSISDNVQMVIDDINRFILLKNFALTDKALFYIEGEVLNIFNGYSRDFKNHKKI